MASESLLKKILQYGNPYSEYYKNVEELLELMDNMKPEEWKYLREMAEKGNIMAIYLLSFYEARRGEQSKEEEGTLFIL
ncbi:MAG: hypothetical protein QXP42_00855 [Candidatus Micrarchaeia archaeon]